MSKVKNSNLAVDLLKWYNRTNQSFEWRNTHDPYKIWLSEIMLQQTQVKTATPYYINWIAKYPTIKTVAQSKLDDLLKQWEGLGYYRRVQYFHLACQIVLEKYGGKVPAILEEFIKLPGVGPYTAAAVLSIAYAHPIPAIDGNVVRVVSRLILIQEKFPRSRQPIFSFLKNIIDVKSPGDFNQAIMDLGRDICRPVKPKCKMCPIQKNCLAYINNLINKYPKLTGRKKRPLYNIAIGVIWKKNKILVSKRNQNVLLAGMWEFPGGKIKKGETPKSCLIREAKEELNIDILPISYITKIKHSYSHFKIIMKAYNCKYIKGQAMAIECADFKWIKPENLDSLAFPSASKKLFNNLNPIT